MKLVFRVESAADIQFHPGAHRYILMKRTGFFSDSEVSDYTPANGTMRCGECGLYRGCQSPKMPVTGEGKQRILITAEAPGKEEDEEGVQLIGKAGQHLRKSLSRMGVNLDRDCWKTNAVVCRPPHNKTPTDAQIAACRPRLLQTIKELDPVVIILLGGVAVKSLIEELWGDSPEGITRWVGWRIPDQRLNAWVCPNWHPSYLLRQQKQPTLQLWFDRYLQRALDLDKRPWQEVPDYKKHIDVVLDAEEASKIIRKMIAKGGRVAFDYECNMLKPDGPKAQIYSCSVCWEGRKTIAFPWYGEAIVAMGELLKSDLPKIGYNAKYEQRWTKKEFGCGVRNFIFDGMQAAHILDNRRGITGAKFQAYINLGQSLYNKEVEPFLKGEGGNEPNRIKEIKMKTLLLYNGMDSLIEFLLAEKMMPQLGIK